MIATLSPGVQSSKFLDINQIHHRFPEDLKSIGFGVTLLHNHPHAKTGCLLLYSSDFNESTYVDVETTSNYSPCSWYLSSSGIIPYEFYEG